MAEEFDSGPLTWVKDEIDQALDTVLANFKAIAAKPSDLTSLRATQTHLYQVSGALDMVGLEGCKRFCAEIENLVAKLDKQQISPDADLLMDAEQAIITLKNYLQDLLSGMPDVPLRLFAPLKKLALAQGDSVDESELFFPDTTQTIPKNFQIKNLTKPSLAYENRGDEGVVDLNSADIDYASFMVEQRVNYQKSLLAWIQKKQDTDLNNMCLAIENVSQVQEKTAQKTLWWAATAFAESLNEEKIRAQAGAMRLCRRLDQQLRIASEGNVKPHAQLLKDILYYVALSEASSANLDAVREVFELQQLMPTHSHSVAINQEATSVTYVNHPLIISLAQQQIIDDLMIQLNDIKHVWDDATEHRDASQAHQALTEFCQLAHRMSSTIGPLAIEAPIFQSMSSYFSNIEHAAIAIKENRLYPSEHQLEIAHIEIAASLQLALQTLANLQSFNGDSDQKLAICSQRLQLLAKGEALSELKMTEKLESETLIALVIQIKEALAIAEQTLDLFFRKPSDTALLLPASKPLQQVVAAFDILNLETATAIAQADLALIQHFSESGYQANQAQFELVAESLSMLELYVGELPKPRPASNAALEIALDKLNAEYAQRCATTIKQDADDKLASQSANEIVNDVANSVSDHEVSAGGTPSDPYTSHNIARLNVQDTTLFNSVTEEIPASNVALVDTNPLAQIPVSLVSSTPKIDDELLEVFLMEVEEVLAQNAQHLQTLRINNTDMGAMAEIRRGFHTLKGSGRTVGLNDLGHVAGFVETMLNKIVERKTFLQNHQISFLEQISAAFAAWAAELQESGIALVNVDEWQARVLAVAQPKASAQIEEVVVGGTRRMSRGLYNVFLQEARQNLAILNADVSALCDNSHAKNAQLKPSEAIKRATHTLASNALTAGFKPMGELGRALENWLDEFKGHWTPDNLLLYKKTVKSLADMAERAAKLLHPRAAPALIKALKNSNLNPVLHETLLDNEELLVVETEPTAELDSQLSSLVKSPVATTNSAVSEILTQAALSSALNQSISEGVTSAVDHDLLDVFIEEARELIPQMGGELRAWRNHPKDQALPDALQRSLHTLKGSARMAGQVNLGDTVHELEDKVIRALKRKIAPEDFEQMFTALDAIGNLFDAAIILNTSPISSAQNAEANQANQQSVAVPTRSAERGSQYLRLRADVLDRLINEAGEISITRSRMDREMLGFKGFSSDLTESVTRLRSYLRELEIEADTQLQSRLNILQEANETFDPLEFDRFTRLQELTRMMAESVNDVATIQQGLITNLDQTESALQQQSRMNREMQQALLNVRMLPFSLLTERLHRIVRQTARELNKQVELIIEGESTELDRSVLDKIGAPLEHLLRNAVAHGIESADERVQVGKSNVGTITLKVRQENDEIILLVSDNGAGVPLARVKAKAITNGLIAADTEVSNQALMAIIFEPGFSTAAEVTQIVGRGVGLDSVRSDISGLGGRIDVDSVEGKATVFTIYIPVTLSVAQVLLVRAGADTIALPVTMIEQAQKLKPEQLAQAYQSGLVRWADKQYALHHLSKLIGFGDVSAEAQNYASVLLLRSGSYHIALHVDEIIGNQEVVMKPIGSQLSRAPGLVGATVTGDGQIVLIMNPVQLANREVLSVGAVKVQMRIAKNIQQKNSVMVVDDSLTMRKVLSRLLERVGFEVIVAKDGMDAMQLLQESIPDLILTDIEMPRLDGFGLVRNIRDDARTKATPVIMISSRTAEKHRSVAAELGVNAFFGKPVQDDELINKINELLKISLK